MTSARLDALVRDERTPKYLTLAAMLFAVPVLIWAQRGGSMPWMDAWPFLISRDGFSVHDLLGGYNGHWMAITAVVMQINTALFGAGSQVLMVAASIGFQLWLVWMIFVFLSRRIDAWIAFAFAVLVLFYGSGYEVVAWSFNLGWVASIAAGIAALVVYDGEPSRGRDIGISALLVFSLLGCNIGLVFVAYFLIRAFDREQRRRAIGIAIAPLVIWGIWALASGFGTPGPGYYPKSWPQFVLDEIAYAFGGLFGILPSHEPEWGPALAVAAVIAMLVELSRRGKIKPELLALAAIPVGFWILTAMGRGGWATASASRYTYTSLVLLLPLFAELARGFKVRSSGLAVGLAAVWLLMLALNLSILLQGRDSLRGGYDFNRTHITALLAAGHDASCASDAKAVDEAIQVYGNCRIYEWVSANGPEDFVWSPAQLQSDPALSAKVAELRAKIAGGDDK